MVRFNTTFPEWGETFFLPLPRLNTEKAAGEDDEDSQSEEDVFGIRILINDYSGEVGRGVYCIVSSHNLTARARFPRHDRAPRLSPKRFARFFNPPKPLCLIRIELI